MERLGDHNIGLENLLNLIHNDKGEFTRENGIQKSIEKAIEKYLRMLLYVGMLENNDDE